MPVVAAVIALAVVVWGAIYARRGSLVVACGVCLIVSYVLGHEFWNARIGPLPVTLDRLALVGLIAAFAIQWRIGQLETRRLTRNDWALIATLTVLVASAFLSGEPEWSDGVTSKWGRLVTSFFVPALFYGIVRHTQLTPRDWSRLLTAFVLLGVYLAVTAVLENAEVWSLVFPRYIADPALGIHFGRARGPELNAASLGLYLTACLWCAWTLLGQSKGRFQRLVIFITLPLMVLGVFFTYTRSTWLGLVASGLVVAALQIPRRWRVPTLAAAGLAGLLIVAVSWGQLTGLKREGSAAESMHSVDQRTSFAYVSWQMFRDHPVFGVGFGRFYDRKLPYLSDRSQDFELESIRSLHHHNTLLSVLVETGMIGFAAFVLLLAVWVRNAWRLTQDGAATTWTRAHGVLMLALVANYLCSAMFHDLTLVASQQGLLFLFAGVAVTLPQSALEVRVVPFEVGRTTGTVISLLGKPAVAHAGDASVDLFGMKISRVTMQETTNQLLGWCGQPRNGSCRYVVTPNVDHAVLFQDRDDLRAAYDNASLVLADGAPIVLASRVLGRRLPERVAGSDLVPRLLDTCQQPLRIFLLGAGPGVAEKAAECIERKWKTARVVGTYSPPLGFESNESENGRILAAIATASPDLLVVGLGAPKQELWVHRHQHQLHAKVAICAGATIDFLAGHRQRSPVWMRSVGLEWLHRVWSEPRRLAARYARDAWVFPQLVWREWRRV